MNALNEIIKWCNENSGFVSLLIFAATLFLGWISGFFKSIIRKPIFKIRIIPGPTLCTTFPVDMQYNGHQVHRTAISVYLNVSNIGTSPASIEKIWVGYHWKSIKYFFTWFWLKEQMVTIEDFQYDFGENVKVYPSLMQGTAITMSRVDTYLQVGKSVTGVVYFEQDNSWGACFPAQKEGKAKFCIKIIDTFGGQHKTIFNAQVMELKDAKKYNPSFGETLRTLRKEN